MARALAPWMEELLLHVAAALVERGPEEVRRAGTGDRLRTLVENLPADRVRLLHAGGRLLRLLARARHGRALARLDGERVRRLLAWLAGSRIRPLRRLGRVLGMMGRYAWYAGEAAWADAGYDGPWIGRVDVAVHAAPEVLP